jgi:hypothetical protein
MGTWLDPRLRDKKTEKYDNTGKLRITLLLRRFEKPFLLWEINKNCFLKVCLQPLLPSMQCACF